MAITAYCGLPGAGKSYEVVRGPILQAFKSGRPIWTNIRLDPALGATIAADDAQHWYLDAPPGALVVIDECWRFWPSGLKADDIEENKREFFTMHRHRVAADGQSTDIILVTQDLGQVARFVRDLVERTYRCLKHSALGSRKHYRCDVYAGSVTGQNPPKSQHVTSWQGRYDPKVFKLYQSHTLSRAPAGEGVKEIDADSRGTVWKRWEVIGLFISLPLWLLLVPLIIRQHTAAFESTEPAASTQHKPPKPVDLRTLKPHEVRREPARAERMPAASNPVPADDDSASSKPTPLSKDWTLIGHIVRRDGSGLALLRGRIGTRRLDLPGPSDFDSAGNLQCMVDGARVTNWSGDFTAALAVASTYSPTR